LQKTFDCGKHIVWIAVFFILDTPVDESSKTTTLRNWKNHQPISFSCSKGNLAVDIVQVVRQERQITGSDDKSHVKADKRILFNSSSGKHSKAFVRFCVANLQGEKVRVGNCPLHDFTVLNRLFLVLFRLQLTR
jgi:hypothetical protein